MGASQSGPQRELKTAISDIIRSLDGRNKKSVDQTIVRLRSLLQTFTTRSEERLRQHPQDSAAEASARAEELLLARFLLHTLFKKLLDTKNHTTAVIFIWDLCDPTMKIMPSGVLRQSFDEMIAPIPDLKTQIITALSIDDKVAAEMKKTGFGAKEAGFIDYADVESIQVITREIKLLEPRFRQFATFVDREVSQAGPLVDATLALLRDRQASHPDNTIIKIYISYLESMRPLLTDARGYKCEAIRRLLEGNRSLSTGSITDERAVVIAKLQRSYCDQPSRSTSSFGRTKMSVRLYTQTNNYYYS